jgi:hypothetical protein
MRQAQIDSSRGLSLSRANNRVMVAQAGGFPPHSGNQTTVTGWMTRMSESGHAAFE